MPRRRFLAVGAVFVLLASGALAQQGRRAAAPALPPLSMTCPVHPDVIEASPGTCPYCNRTLVPVRLAPAWTCPVHPATIADDRGTCPICRRQLVPVTVSLTFACAGSQVEQLEPGTCPGGAAMTLKRTLRPHGDHNPRHGGQFFMASDNWHHVEGVYPSSSVFRLYVYDDYARPLPLERMKALRARVVTSERFDAATNAYVEQRAFPLGVAPSGAYLEARIDRPALPAEMTAKIRFDQGGPEQRFDFTFVTVTQPPAAATSTSRATGSRGVPATPNGGTRGSRASTPPAPAAAPAIATAAPGSGADPALVALPIPGTVAGILDQMRARDQQVGALIARGDFGAVWVPAFQAKDLALALEAHLAHLDGATRDAGASALQRVVRLSWLLDAHGDTGNRQQLLATHESLSKAIADTVAVFGEMKH